MHLYEPAALTAYKHQDHGHQLIPLKADLAVRFAVSAHRQTPLAVPNVHRASDTKPGFPRVSDYRQGQSAQACASIPIEGSTGVLQTSHARLLSAAVFEWPTGIFHHLSYVNNPCNRGVGYGEHDADFGFDEWMFPEQNWCGMMWAFRVMEEIAPRSRLL
jgi:hypothetical protein